MQTSPDPFDHDLPTSPEEWEQIRRSVAMLSPGAWALRREPALHALGLLIGRLRVDEAATEPPGA